MEQNFPKDEIEFSMAWNQCAGRKAALDGVVGKLQKEAGQFFVMDRDKIAEVLRSLANQFIIERDEASKQLQGYIDEDNRRHGRQQLRK